MTKHNAPSFPVLLQSIATAFQTHLTLDLGTYKTRVLDSNGNFIFHEITPGELGIERGVVTDIHQSSKALQQLLGEAVQTKVVEWLTPILFSGLPFSPSCTLVVPSSSSPLERKGAAELAKRVGFSTVSTITQLDAVSSYLQKAQGSGLKKGVVVMVLGEGVSEVAAVSPDGVGMMNPLPDLTGSSLNRELQNTLRELCRVEVGMEQVRNLKHSLGAVPGFSGVRTSFIVRGKDAQTGSLLSQRIELRQVQHLFDMYVDRVEQALQELLSSVPSAQLVDIFDQGVLLVGGGAQMKGLPQVLTQRLGVPVELMTDSEHVVVKGAYASARNRAGENK